MAAMIVIEQLAYIDPMIAYSARSASSNGSSDFPAVTSSGVSASLEHKDQLVDNGDGTYTFTSDITSAYSYHDESGDRLRFQSDTYEFDKPGKYLIELWGGDGGDGSSLFPLSYKAGSGGKGGFVYGVLDVTPEDVAAKKKLYYEIGSKGLSQTRSVAGGGTGGIGGGAGDIAVFSVGAGGGYSAVYMLDENETFDPETTPNNPEKVLMIAGGGGGGGAGAALHTLPGVFGGDGRANGGEGGSFSSSLSGTPNIKAFTSGTYYAGENGETSGTKAAYVGQGGTDRPGELVKSFIGFLEASSYPNDWQKSYHPDADRGIGGASNFRGGGGGAGFAGGSGGMQNEPLDARNVGGGGGGSSYVGTYSNFTKNTKGSDDLFVKRDGNTNADAGGAVVIRYLPDSNSDYAYLDNITVSGGVSEYFDIVSMNCTNNKYNASSKKMQLLNVSSTKTDNNFTVSGSVAPVPDGLDKGQAQDTLIVSITVRPKKAFFGGLNVPIFTGDFAVKDSDDLKSSTISYTDNVTHVNVPYNISIVAKNSTKQTGDIVLKGDLFEQEIAYDAADPMQDFISGITYRIDNISSNSFNYTITADDVANGRKGFAVKAELVPKNNTAAAVGNAGNSTVTKPVYVRCISDSILNVDGFEINAKKSLVYNEADDTYDLTVDMGIVKNEASDFFIYDTCAGNLRYFNKTVNQQTNHLPDSAYTDNTRVQETMNYQEEEFDIDFNNESRVLGEGFYYIQVWGADGGNGGPYRTGNGNYQYTSGSSGGAGAYIDAYIYVPNGTIIKASTGLRGYDGGYFNKTGSNYRTNNYGIDCDNNDNFAGYGGGYTKLTIGDSVIVAGGGGGGTPKHYATTTSSGAPTIVGQDGAPGETDFIRVDSADEIQLDQCNGGSGSVENRAAVTPGTGGKSYMTGDFMEELPDDIKDNLILTINPNKPSTVINSNYAVHNGLVAYTKLAVKGGYGYNDTPVTTTLTADDVTSLKADPTDEIRSCLTNDDLKLTETISKYFDIVGIKVNGADDNSTVYPITNGNAPIDKTVTVGVNNAYVSNIREAYSETYCPLDGHPEYQTTKHYYSYNFTGDGTVTFKLRPKASFLGGNDVPLLISAVLSHGSNSQSIEAEYATDFANVRLASETLADVNYITVDTSPIFVEYSGTLSESDFTKTKKTFESSDLADDFAQFTDFGYEPGLNNAITEDTNVIVTAGLEPTSENAAKATVIDPVSRAERNFSVPVYVKYPISTSLTNVTAALENGDQLPGFFPTSVDDRDLTIVLSAVDGYDLPAADDVEVTGAEASIEKRDGNIYVTIPRSTITGAVTVTASGVQVTHKVHYMYEYYDPLSEQISVQSVVDTHEYKNGDLLEGLNFPNVTGAYPVGYDDYDWDFGQTEYDDVSGKYVMGQEDIYIIGTYVPITYKLVINYLETGTGIPCHEQYISPDRTQYHEDTDTFDIALTKGADFFIKSPDITGCVTDTPYVSGKVDNAFINSLNETITIGEKTYKSKTINVYYESNPDNVIVHLVKCDVRGVPIENDGYTISCITEDFNVGDDYDMESDIAKTINSGYEIIKRTRQTDAGEVEVTTVSGTITDQIETYYVYYRAKPGKVTVEFYKERDDASPDKSKTCEVGREYGYNADLKEFDSLPRAVKDDYRLVGWETEDGKLIEDDTIVEGENDTIIKLYAKWASMKVTIHVDYLYAENVADVTIRGTEADTPFTEDYLYGQSYKIVSGHIQNYEAVPGVVEGIALEDKTEKVYYKDGSGEISITVDVYSESSLDNTANAHKLKGGTFELYNSSGECISTKQNTDGSVTWTNVEVRLTDGEKYTVKCTDPPVGYAPGEIEVTVQGSETHEEMFLGKTKFRMPFAGSTPMTGYTVVGTSTMLLAVFLLFLNMRSKAEEKRIKNN